MKIAMITVTYNDEYKFKEWCQWYEEYKEDIYIHIIVDNGSEEKYKQKLKAYFTKSIIVERATNGGSTIAYNDGIRVALSDNTVDAIFLMGNDIRLEKGGISCLYNYLYSDEKLGMVGPILLEPDGTVASYGVMFDFLNNGIFLDKRKQLTDIHIKTKYVDTIPGGVTLSKRSFYEIVGLQDERLFMYGDERDMFFRSKKNKLYIGVTSQTKAWHCHIVCPNPKFRLRSNYLIARNRVYLGFKHKYYAKTMLLVFYTLIVKALLYLRDIKNKDCRKQFYQYIDGVIQGLRGNMANNNVWYEVTYNK